MEIESSPLFSHFLYAQFYRNCLLVEACLAQSNCRRFFAANCAANAQLEWPASLQRYYWRLCLPLHPVRSHKKQRRSVDRFSGRKPTRLLPPAQHPQPARRPLVHLLLRTLLQNRQSSSH